MLAAKLIICLKAGMRVSTICVQAAASTTPFGRHFGCPCLSLLTLLTLLALFSAGERCVSSAVTGVMSWLCAA
jgi:hypothetical protein